MDTTLLGPIRFDASIGRFQASVRLVTPQGAWTYACEVSAALDTPEAEVETGLHREALRRHLTAPGLRSTERTPLAAPRPAAERSFWRDIVQVASASFRPAA